MIVTSSAADSGRLLGTDVPGRYQEHCLCSTAERVTVLVLVESLPIRGLALSLPPELLRDEEVTVH